MSSKKQPVSKPNPRGVVFHPRPKCQYIALNKPYGVLSQFSREENSEKKTLAEFGLPPQVYPIGRLDYDSEGLLILSDDRTLNAKLLDPVYGHCRTYLVQVERIPDENALAMLETGVVIEGRKTLPAGVRLLGEDEPDWLWTREVPVRFRKSVPTCWIELTLTEGKNRQVRRMTAAAGHPTLRLVRSTIGKLSLQELQLLPGDWLQMEADAVQRLFLM